MTTPLRPPKDGIRAMPPGSLQGDGKTLTGRLATGWAEIESVAEGHFMERFAPGAFRKTFSENRDNIKVLFQHGRDMSVGQQPIAVLADVGEDADGKGLGHCFHNRGAGKGWQDFKAALGLDTGTVRPIPAAAPKQPPKPSARITTT